ncbi:uncharacterized protein BO72DRAFT_490501 [Aspergillus fijiensis CBS 313.89]|uniref:DUF7587 domain-containing protein n=1 Tax=Aspergillus fijiensis CBS 313.89 TaxID=1448319 RepID=A0A8G1RDW1_9EURO|nr:uncharacterized protein BO72DRAFT_490501 [Aspergillus fijiensis CBS 313.89]RAK71465.1 hypothetical protein BO72DRAFT_490501 [Aspergillus fijiensis CBS 313.89]
MPVHQVRELHGLQNLPSVATYYFASTGKPLTEEKEEYNRTSRHTRELTAEFNRNQLKLCCLLDDKLFVAESLQYVTSKMAGTKIQTARPMIERVETRQGLTLSEKTDILSVRLRDASLGHQANIESLRIVNRYLISQAHSNPMEYPESDTPELFYRAFQCGSYSRHSMELGFRSSNQPLTPPAYHDGTLLNSLLVNKDSLTNHCEGNQPSDLIALSDSPSRVLNILKTWGYSHRRGDMIAVINVSKLFAMRVLFNRTTTLAEKLGMKLWSGSQSTGLQYANPNYWVAYRWIPAECIECYVSEDLLQEACQSHGIDESDYTARLSLNEIVALKFQLLSMQQN